MFGVGAREARWRTAVWRVADPKITLASMSSLFLGACAAARDGAIPWAWLGVTVAGIFFLEAAKNASGEVFDWDSGADQAVAEADRSPFSGGKRVLVDGLLTRRQTLAMAAAFYSLGIAAGFLVVALREPRVLWFGAAGVALAFFYHAPPLRLSYRGLGELAVALAYGPLIAGGCYLVLRGALPAWVLWAPAPLALLVAAFLWINEFPDARADEAARKRTLVVRLGRRRAADAFAVIVAAALALVALLPLLGVPRGVWLGLVAAVPAVRAVLRLREAPEDTPRIVPAQGWTLLSFVVFALGAGLGVAAIR